MGIYVFFIYCKVYMYTHAQTCKTSRTAGFPALEPFTPTPEKTLVPQTPRAQTLNPNG